MEILGVNLVDPAPVVAQYATTNHIPFPILFDGGHGFSLKTVSMSGRNTAFLINPGKEAILEIPGFPTTYIIDLQEMLWDTVLVLRVGIACLQPNYSNLSSQIARRVNLP